MAELTSAVEDELKRRGDVAAAGCPAPLDELGQLSLSFN
jgi:hypothetical protein